MKLDKPFDLKAGKLVASKCVEVKWNKVESGACFVKYGVKLKDAFHNQLYNKFGYNIGEMRICNLRDFASVTNVGLTVSFKNTYKTINANVTDQSITIPSPTATGKLIRIGIVWFCIEDCCR